MNRLLRLAMVARSRVLSVVGARTLGVRGIVIDPAGRIALVRHTYLPGWYLPGGGVERGESTQAALSRELREEIGVEAHNVVSVLGMYHALNEGRDDHVTVFVVQLDAAQATKAHAADGIEIARMAWFPPDALPTDTSPATARRLAEYRGDTAPAEVW